MWFNTLKKRNIKDIIILNIIENKLKVFIIKKDLIKVKKNKVIIEFIIFDIINYK